jgi:hypothetical protein
VFEHDGVEWTPHAKLVASDDTEGGLGSSVATDGVIVLASDSKEDAEPLEIADAGSLYVFPRDSVPGPPEIDSLTASPDPVLVGNDVTLTALGVRDPDDNVVNVAFYRDTDGNGTGDVLMGTDTTGSDGWSVVENTGGFTLGTHAYVAQATDEAGNSSNVVSATVRVVDASTPETHDSTDTPRDITDGHPKNGRARTTTSTLEILPQDTAIENIGTLDLVISIDGGGTDMIDLSAVLISPMNTTETIATLTSGTYTMSAFGGEPLAGTWTLEITDSVKTSPHVLDSWSLVVTPTASTMGNSQAPQAAAVDQLLAQAEEDEKAPLQEPLVDELALMLME